MDWSKLVTPAVGLLGVPLGVLLGEFVRRRHRAEQFAAAIFAKRLEAYEELMVLVEDGRTLAEQVLRKPELSHEDRHALISAAIGPIAQHTDRNSLYIDEELGAHCTALFMGVEDIPELSAAEKKAALKTYRDQVQETRRMIFEDSGIAKANKFFRDVHRPRITSPVIEYIRQLRKGGAEPEAGAQTKSDEGSSAATLDAK
jgi:hypothetical protein